MVALLTSLGTLFGSRVTLPGTGVLLSNHLQSFDPEPGRPNSIAPGKRAMRAAPAVLAWRDGLPYAAISGSGGRRITGGVLHTMLNLIDFGQTIQPAIEAPRLHTETGEVYVDARIPADVRADLVARGHRLTVVRESVAETHFGCVVGVTRQPEGMLHAGADPLHSAATGGI
jgi:gamma-glutamyltranspeptidase/glutathione hydrolase